MNMAVAPPREPGPARAVVLLVEDNVLVGMAAVGMLESLGYEAHRVTNGRKALAALDANAAIALMIADIGLPDMDGHELAARARAQRPRLPVLFITGYDRAGPRRMPADEITGYLEKPYHPSAMDEALGRLLAAA